MDHPFAYPQIAPGGTGTGDAVEACQSSGQSPGVAAMEAEPCAAVPAAPPRRTPARFIDLTDQQFGTLTVIGRAGTARSGKVLWRCWCLCGRETRVRGGGHGCGGHGCGSVRHGHARDGQRSPTYSSWHAMLRRCSNPNCKDYPRYGGRGIWVCPEWIDSFETFLRDMGPRPKGMTLDRINNDGNYEPGNVRWADARLQAANRRPAAKKTQQQAPAA